MGIRLANPLIAFACSAAMFFPGCKAPADAYSPLLKLPADLLEEDFAVLRGALTELHPALYEYAGRDEMDSVFERGLDAVEDSMTESRFAYRVIAPVLSRIRCGHTSLSLSDRYTRAMRGIRLPSFPLHVKTWGDTMVVTRVLGNRDSTVGKGDLLKSVDGLGPARLRAVMSSYLSADGFNETLNEVRLSTAFPYYHRNIFGLREEYKVAFMDSLGRDRVVVVECHVPGKDTALDASGKGKTPPRQTPGAPRPERRPAHSLKFESDIGAAIMDIPSFERSSSLKTFYRKAFRDIERKGVRNLVIDIRNNGGGRLDSEVLLARYLKPQTFRVADTAAAVSRNLGVSRKYIHGAFWNETILRLMTRKEDDGTYRLRYWERHVYKPKKHRFFDGSVYILTGGPTFSAAALFAGSLKGQPNVTIVGEETGGGAYSNNGLLIPTLRLPNTGIKVRIPLFRLVPVGNATRDGRGVPPDVPVRPTWESVRSGMDRKMEVVRSLIRDKG